MSTCCSLKPQGCSQENILQLFSIAVVETAHTQLCTVYTKNSLWITEGRTYSQIHIQIFTVRVWADYIYFLLKNMFIIRARTKKKNTGQINDGSGVKQPDPLTVCYALWRCCLIWGLKWSFVFFCIFLSRATLCQVTHEAISQASTCPGWIPSLQTGNFYPTRLIIRRKDTG